MSVLINAFFFCSTFYKNYESYIIAVATETMIAYTANNSVYPYYLTKNGVKYPPIIIANPVPVVKNPSPLPYY